jgi:hypothetical protein
VPGIRNKRLCGRTPPCWGERSCVGSMPSSHRPGHAGIWHGWGLRVVQATTRVALSFLPVSWIGQMAHCPCWQCCWPLPSGGRQAIAHHVPYHGVTSVI